jgi:hypothetical protein
MVVIAVSWLTRHKLLFAGNMAITYFAGRNLGLDAHCHTGTGVSSNLSLREDVA